VLGDGSLRDGLVARGRERAERYSMASLAEAYLAIYRGLLDAEESKEIVVGRSRLLRLYEDRILRRGPATDRSSG
jgi:hypothetical protein